jgi:hypothetical protein
MGTVNELTTLGSRLEDCETLLAISGGTSSGAGIGSPLAAANSCASVQESS